MTLPTHLVEHISTYTDPDTRMRLGCTCRDMRPTIRQAKINRFMGQKLMLREYQLIRDFVGAEYIIEPDEWIDQWLDNTLDGSVEKYMVSGACIKTLDALYGIYRPESRHRHIDPELYDLVRDELHLDCPDYVLLFSFWRKVERAGFI
jgi:hypothetical protein